MVTFIIIVKQRSIQKEILSELKNLFANIQILLATEVSNQGLKELDKKDKNVKVFHFPDNTSEEDMIESLVNVVEGQSLCIIRDDGKNVDVGLAKRCVIKQREGYDIVMPKSNKKTNFLKRFFSKLTNSIVSKVFGFNLFEGNISIQVFSKNAINILKTNGTGSLTKVNKWLGANIGYIDENIEKFKPKTNKLKNLRIWTILYFIVFVCFLATTITLPILFSIPWLLILLLIFGTLIGVSLFTFNFLRFYIKKQVGELFAKKVGIIDTDNK